MNKEIENWENDYADVLEKGTPTEWRDFVRELLSKALRQQREKIKRLIVDETLIAREEGTPTSRLTSLYMKISELTKSK